MEPLLRKYEQKLETAGLAEPGSALLAGLDDELVWSRADEVQDFLRPLFGRLPINSLVFVRPGEPYRLVLEELCGPGVDVLSPQDCETRTFLHDIPVVEAGDFEALAGALARRKGAVVRGLGLAAHGSVSPEQGFVTVSSILFAATVKLFGDALADARRGGLGRRRQALLARVESLLPPTPEAAPKLMRGPFSDEASARAAMDEAGAHTVRLGLVDSYFGNISCRLGDVVHISQTGSSLDELAGAIDPCPMDDSSCAGLTASSELTAHAEVYRRSDASAILHGHPRFSVVLSMDCPRLDCPERGRCFAACPEERFAGGAPVVPGEVGTGPAGLCHTLPPALDGRRAAVVLGHGVFATGRADFNEAFQALLDVESASRRECMRRLGGGSDFGAGRG
ncbi:MAG: class II aldolase/adducin family protein [Desulfovibrionaceae bacterium]